MRAQSLVQLAIPLALCLGVIACSAARFNHQSNSGTECHDDLIKQTILQSSSPLRAEWMAATDALAHYASQDAKTKQTIWERARVNSFGIKFALISAGDFEMGPDIPGTDTGEPAHPVRLTRQFFISVTEITNAQMARVDLAYRPNTPSWSLPDLPAVGVTWEEAARFCANLSTQEGAVYRLPTEAEWEYACRAGSKTPYCFGGDVYTWPAELDQYAWCAKSHAPPASVAERKPNAWGLYDMHGNAFEWVSDWYRQDTYAHDLAVGLVVDPIGPSEGLGHVLRGGAWPDIHSLSFMSTRRFRPSLLLGKPIGLYLFDSNFINIQQTYGFRVVREYGLAESESTFSPNRQ